MYGAMRRTCLFAGALLLLAGCGGGDAEGGEGEHHEEASAGGEHHGEHHGGEHHGEHGEGGGHEHGDMHPALHAFHEVLAPAWHADPGEARVAASCEASAQLVELTPPLGEAMAEHVREAGGTDEDATAPGANLATATASLGEACGADEVDGTAVEERIAGVHDAFHVIMEGLQGE